MLAGQKLVQERLQKLELLEAERLKQQKEELLKKKRERKGSTSTSKSRSKDDREERGFSTNSCNHSLLAERKTSSLPKPAKTPRDSKEDDDKDEKQKLWEE